MFLSDGDAFDLAGEYGTPLYVYDEATLRASCRDMRGLLPNKNFRVSYSIKANSNIELLKIIKSEDIDVDAMSEGEIFLAEKAGYAPEQIFFVPNNISAEEMRRVAGRGILTSADSLSQLETLGRACPGAKAALRFNPGGAGVGHHLKVVTAGKNTKFGIDAAFINEACGIAKKYNLKVAGINQHLGSLFIDYEPFLRGAEALLGIARNFPDLEFIDFGGGFGVPYAEGGERLNLPAFSARFGEILSEFLNSYANKNVLFKTEPGRYIAAECGVLLGRVTALKTGGQTEYIGCDLGFNTLMRPVLYDSYHALRVHGKNAGGVKKTYTVVGNICESGDILAKDREMPECAIGDLIEVQTAGAYGFAMASSYNARPRPAEVLIRADKTRGLIRRRETFDDLMAMFL